MEDKITNSDLISFVQNIGNLNQDYLNNSLTIIGIVVTVLGLLSYFSFIGPLMRRVEKQEDEIKDLLGRFAIKEEKFETIVENKSIEISKAVSNSEEKFDLLIANTNNDIFKLKKEFIHSQLIFLREVGSLWLMSSTGISGFRLSFLCLSQYIVLLVSNYDIINLEEINIGEVLDSFISNLNLHEGYGVVFLSTNKEAYKILVKSLESLIILDIRYFNKINQIISKLNDLIEKTQ